MAKDYIPDGDPEFDDFQENLIEIVEPKIATWGILQSDFDELKAFQQPWTDTWKKAKNKKTRSSGDVEAKDDARADYEPAIRQFVKQWLSFNKKITNQEKVEMGLTVPDESKTPRPSIADAPIVGLKALSGAMVEVRCRVTADASRSSMHPDADAVEYCFKIGDPPPANADECTTTKVVKKALFQLKLKVSDATKRLYLYARWKNTSDDSKSGPWSKLVQTVISD